MTMGRCLGCAESAVLFSGKLIGLQILRFCHGNIATYSKYCACVDHTCYTLLHNTVELPNKGHFGNGHFVLFSYAVPISEACVSELKY